MKGAKLTEKTDYRFEEVTYISNSQYSLTVDMYLPVGEKEKYPCVIYCFGGSWKRGTKKQFANQAHILANMGIACAVPEYRVKEKHGVTPEICLQDCIYFIDWLTKNANNYRIDTDNLVYAGSSAGGLLALDCGIMDSDEFFGGYNVPTPKCIFANCPALDYKNTPNMEKLLGEYASKISPMENIKENCPPVLIQHSIVDEVVPFSTAMKFAEKYLAMNNMCTLIPYDTVGHGFFNIFKITNDTDEAEVQNRIRNFTYSMHSIIGFLKHVGINTENSFSYDEIHEYANDIVREKRREYI